MPRPSSSTWTLPSACSVTTTFVAWPATPSSVEVSTTSEKRGLMPRLSAEPSHHPGGLRTASRPSRWVRSSAPYKVSAVTGSFSRIVAREKGWGWGGLGLPPTAGYPPPPTTSARSLLRSGARRPLLGVVAQVGPQGEQGFDLPRDLEAVPEVRLLADRREAFAELAEQRPRGRLPGQDVAVGAARVRELVGVGLQHETGGLDPRPDQGAALL